MSINKSEIMSQLKKLQPTYNEEGLYLLGLFGSYAKETQTEMSDIDIAYKVDYELFSKKYVDGFSKVLRLDTVKEELQTIFQKRVDFVSSSNKAILKDLIYV